MLTVGLKHCGGCDRALERSDFSKNRTQWDGLQSQCKECVAARQAKRKVDGLCRDCPSKAVPGRTRCLDHAAEDRARLAARRTADPEGESAPKRAANRRAYAAARAEGRCVWEHGRGCQSPADEGLTLCTAHRAEQAERSRIRYLKPILTEARAGDASWEARELWSCSYCAGPFDEVEHKVARNSADGAKGSNDPGNLVPACWGCNRRKRNRPYAEWVASEFPHLVKELDD